MGSIMISKKPFIVIAAAVLVLLGLLSVPSAQPAEAGSGRQVWAFYMGFWGGPMTWDWQAGVLTDRPAIGAYDSRQAGVAATHIDQAKSAGIDAFIVSWFGVGDGLTTTPVLNNMLDRAAERGFAVAAAVDVFDPNYNRNRDGMVNSLNWLVHDRANHPAYLRYNGKPVIFFVFQERAGLTDADWLAIRNQVDPNRSTIWIAEGIGGCCLHGGAMDGMYAFNLAWANGSVARFTQEKNATLRQGGSLYIPTVHPGWNEDLIAARDGRPNPTSPRDRAGGQFLANSFNGAVASGADVILIVSWNEFMENSHIEPSQLYGTQSLDTLRPLIAAWKGGASAAPSSASVPPSPPVTTASPTGSAVQAMTWLNVRSGPGVSYSRIGQIGPGTPYPVLGKQGSWYAINYNGQTGYVSGAYVTLSGGEDVTAAPSGGARTIQAVTVLNVRSGPGVSYSRIGQIKPGTPYPVLGEQDGWYAISYNGQTGYVFGLFVR